MTVIIDGSRSRFRDRKGEWAPGLVWGSPEWFEEALVLFVEESLLAPAHLAGASFSLQEVIYDIPPDNATYAWHIRVVDGRVVEGHWGDRVPDVDIEIVASWPDVVHAARLLRSDPEYDLRIAQLRVDGTSVVHLRNGPEPMRQYREMFARIHDRMALRTR
jgi:hypothetical protein